jgi:hypothetical protein
MSKITLFVVAFIGFSYVAAGAEEPAAPPVQPLTDSIGAPPRSGSSPSIDQPASEPKVFKIVDARDLYVGTRKYFNRDIEVQRMRCYYADVEDYRCVTDAAGLSVFSKSIEPQSSRSWIEENCDQVKKIFSDRCLVSIRFSYDADDVDRDLVSGYRERVSIHPPLGILVSRAEGQPRRSRK